MVGVLDRGKKFSKFFNSPIDQLKFRFQVAGYKLRVSRERTGSINRTPTFHLHPNPPPSRRRKIRKGWIHAFARTTKEV